MIDSTQRPGSRTVLVYATLLVCAVALLGTSAPPWWNVEQTQRANVSFQPDQPARMTTEAVVLYRTPKGRWPLTLSAQIATPHYTQPPSAKLNWEVQLHDQFAAEAKTEQSTARDKKYEIACDDELCEGMITMALSIDYIGGAIAGEDAGSQSAGDAGADGDAGSGAAPGDELRVQASFPGGIESDPVWSCDRKDSSTDSDTPPEELGLELTLAALAYDVGAPTIARQASAPSTLAVSSMATDAGGVLVDAGSFD